MQFPGMALHNVRQYLEEVDPERAEAVAEGLHCLEVFANSPTGRFPEIRYRDQTDEYREICEESFEAVRTELVGNRAEYEAVAGPDAFALALQNLRVAFQHHLGASGGQSRDESMAENTVWISDQLGPESRMVLWAHNFHVSTQPGAQGAYLRETFGDEMVVVGFSQEGGRFTARDFREESRPLLEFELEPPLTDSFEHFLSRATAPRFVLDLRGVDTSAAGSSWLAGLRPFRHIGCCVRSSLDDPSWQWTDTPLTEWYDLIIHFESTRATTLLPRNPPSVW